MTLWSNGSLLGLAVCFVNLKVVAQIPSRAIILPWMFFHYTPQLHGILQDILLPRDGSHLSAERSKQNGKVRIAH